MLAYGAISELNFPKDKTSSYNLLIDVNLSRHIRDLLLDVMACEIAYCPTVDFQGWRLEELF